jgi:hypothetical protein
VKILLGALIVALLVWAGWRLFGQARRPGGPDDQVLPNGGDGHQVEPPVAGPAS